MGSKVFTLSAGPRNVITTCNETVNILVGTDPLVIDAPSNWVAFWNEAEVRSRVGSLVHSTRQQCFDASLSRNTSVVCSASVSNRTHSGSALAWVLTCGHRGVAIVSGTTVTVIAHSGIGNENTLRTVGVGRAIDRVGGAWVTVITHHRGYIAVTSRSVTNSRVARVSVAIE